MSLEAIRSGAYEFTEVRENQSNINLPFFIAEASESGNIFEGMTEKAFEWQLDLFIEKFLKKYPEQSRETIDILKQPIMEAFRFISKTRTLAEGNLQA